MICVMNPTCSTSDFDFAIPRECRHSHAYYIYVKIIIIVYVPYLPTLLLCMPGGLLLKDFPYPTAKLQACIINPRTHRRMFLGYINHKNQEYLSPIRNIRLLRFSTYV